MSDRVAETPRPNAVSNVVPGTAAGGNAAGSGPASLTAPTNAVPSTSASLPLGVTPAVVKPLPTPGATPGAESPATRDVFGETRDRLRDAVRRRTPGEQPRPGEAMDPQPGTESGSGAGSDASGVPEDPYEARMAKLRAMLDPNQRRRAPLIDPNIPDDELTPEQRAARAAERGDFAGVDEELLAIIRDAKVTTSTLVMDPESKDAIDAQMLRGQRLMGEQRYFDAEEQFARVVSFRPGNTAALIGRAHAQLGAGLFLSSALNLREVFANQPETIAVRYQHPAIPDSDRLRVLIERLRTNLQRGRAMNESALLLAYVGHQLDDAAIRREGIEAMRAVDLGDPLPSVLEAAWAEEK